MGATTFMEYEKERAAKLAAAGETEAAAKAMKESNKFNPNLKHMTLGDEEEMKERKEAAAKAEAEKSKPKRKKRSKKVEIDLDGDGDPDVVITSDQE